MAVSRNSVDVVDGHIAEGPARRSEDSADVVDVLLNDPHAIVNYAPEERFLLGRGSVMALVANQMIGSTSLRFLPLY